jgi:predicted phage terminase large subunit-like protein
MRRKNLDLKTLSHQARVRIANNARRELARRHFWFWCNYVSPDFYKPSRDYLIDICQAMEEFENDDNGVLIVDAPPRFGKSRTLCLYVEWLFGRNPKYHVMTGSYNEILSGTFAKSVRDAISENYGKYSWTFPNTRIKPGDAAMSMWSLEGSDVKSYLATSPSGTATGFGADFIIIDDIIKSAYEANNPAILDKHWDWFANTMYSRLEGKRKILIFMTQWSSGDLPHRAKEHFESIGVKVRQLLFSAVKPDGTMLCDEILSREEYEHKKATIDPVIFECNYNNKVIESSDALYDVRSFHTYQLAELPKEGLIKSRTDTADEGSDWLVKITYKRYGDVIYLLDVFMSKDKMEVTEPECARRDKALCINVCTVESNNGGKGFARMEELDSRKLGNTLTRYLWKPTTQNKEARILTQSTRIQNVVCFPSDWATRWRDFYNAFAGYKKSGKNEHDDAPDCLTAVCEDEFEHKVFIQF